MKGRITLLIDAVINLILAILLLSFSPEMADIFGVPTAHINIYPNILGAVFLGITIALGFEAYRNPDNRKTIGLGLVGAVCINRCGGFVLLLWLIFGNLALPVRGKMFLWSLDLILLLISTVELLNIWNKR